MCKKLIKDIPKATTPLVPIFVNMYTLAPSLVPSPPMLIGIVEIMHSIGTITHKSIAEICVLKAMAAK